MTGSRRTVARAQAAILLAALPFAPAALAGPSIAGPSVAAVATTPALSGRGFAPNAAVTVAVRAPGGAEAHHGAVVAADGTLRYALPVTRAGGYTVRVLDSGGRELAATTVHATH